MVYDICLNVCSLLIMLVITLGSGRQYTELTEQNRHFRRLTFATEGALVFDTLAAVCISYPQRLPVSLNALSQMLGFAMVALMAYCYAGYMETFPAKEKRSPVFHMLNRIILIVYYLTHALNLFAGFIFYFDDRRIYQRGVCYLLVYIVPFYYFIYGVVVMFVHRREMEQRKLLATVSLVPFALIGALLQFGPLSNYLVILFAVSLGEMIIFFNFETPDYQKLTRTMEQLEQSRRDAEEASRAKSSFFAQMSHEIRTPINAVLGMNEMILRESHEKAVTEYASNAYNAGKALLSTINDILDISKIEAGKLELVEAEYELYSLVSDCYHMTAERAQKKNLKFLVSADEELPSKLYGDMFHIRQIIVNFLTNAIKYTEKGSVELALTGARRGEALDLKISVKDTGIGLSEESMQKLFTSFQRFDMGRNQGVEGTGLGLSICKQLAELMGGSVGAESEYGRGSTFFCTIPQRVLCEEPVGKLVLNRSTESQERSGGKVFTAERARILVVDDVEMNLIVFTSLLKGHKLQIDRATSGAQCLGLVQKQQYDVIFMDHMMPEMDGMETFARMGEMEHRNRNTPVIMLTANAISGEREKYLDAGFASYLTKPIQSDKLEELLLAYLPKEKVIWELREEPENDGAAEAAGELQKEARQELLDAALGLNYAGGDRDSYHRILASYVSQGEEKLSRIGALYEKEAWKDYVTEVHALKSTSLTIGARPLSEAAAALEAAGKAGDYELIRQKQEALLALYGSVLELGKEMLGAEAEPLSPAAEADTGRNLREITAELLAEYRARMQRAAESFDADALLSLCVELAGYSCGGTALAVKFQSVKDAAEDFECERAGEAAERVFEKLLRECLG